VFGQVSRAPSLAQAALGRPAAPRRCPGAGRRARQRETTPSNRNRPESLLGASHKEADMGRGILLWLLGVPIPIIILLALFWH
jgi:hypothetical protein